MAAHVMQVNGFQFQGKVYIALDEDSDYYRIYGEKDGTTKEYHYDIAFDELGDVLDSMTETGGMTKEEYQAKVKDFCGTLLCVFAVVCFVFFAAIYFVLLR